MNAFDWILLVTGGALLLPIGVVALEVAAALWRPRGAAGTPLRKPVRVAVVIPAHDEERTIEETLASVMPQLKEGDRVVVVADNCRDLTAELARAAGARVEVRHNWSARGKGFALAAGIDALREDPPDVVVIVDADMLLDAGSIEALAASVARHGTPVQALDLLKAAKDTALRVQISAFAFLFKNQVRALGADRLGVPCMLRGTGMAFPWKMISASTLATDNLVEDMQLGLDLAAAGSAPRFCPGARVTGCMSDRTETAAVQRTRWEHGHLQTILRNAPRLLWLGIITARPGLIGLSLDLAVPPLALLVLHWLAVTFVAALLGAGGIASYLPLQLLLAAGGLLALSIFGGWVEFARHLLPARALLSIPLYVLWKVPLYFAFPWKRQQTWIRTERAS